MGLASILAVYRKVVLAAGLVAAVALAACSSPLDLDVDRHMAYDDGTVHPVRASLFYYFGDSAYEAIFIDRSLMQSITIDTSQTPYRITIPQFTTPTFSCTANWDWTPLVKGFGFSTTSQPCDERLTEIINRRTYVNVERKHMDGTRAEYLWFVDGLTKRLSIGFLSSPNNRLIKGRIVIDVVDPDRPRMLTYYGILTLEY